jgi:uncharacterized SAM-binding protein YcdF (DUF218 family)
MSEEEPKIDVEQEEDERREGQADALIVFGFGIKDPLYLQRMKEQPKLPGEVQENAELDASQAELSKGWMLSLGAKLRVQAAAELYLHGQTKEIVFSGGATRLEKEGIQETEAELMESYFLHILRKRKIEELKNGQELNPTNKRDIENAADSYIDEARSNIIKEDKATNTIENFSRTLSMIEKNPDKYKKIALLSNRFHITRIGMLAEQFQLDASKFSAEDVLLATRADKRHGDMVYRILDNYTNPNQSEEYRNFLMAENRWSRGLKEVPKNSLPQMIYVSGERLRDILKALAAAEEVYENYLKEIGIRIEDLDYPEGVTEEEKEALDKKLSEKIGKIKRELPPAEWNSATPPK